MGESTTPPEENKTEGLDYSGAKKPWIVVVLIGAIIYLVTWIRDKDVKLEEVQKARAADWQQISRERQTNQQQSIDLARISKDMLDKSDYYELLKDSIAYYRRCCGGSGHAK